MLVKLVYTAVALAIGMGFAVQTNINAALARGIDSPVVAALISFGVGFIALVATAFATGQFQTAHGFRNLPVWMWLSGGIMGACIVFGSLYLVPRIGVAALAALIIAGQLAAAALIDNYGLLGVPVHEINLMRVLGIAMLLCGAILVRFN